MEPLLAQRNPLLRACSGFAALGAAWTLLAAGCGGASPAPTDALPDAPEVADLTAPNDAGPCPWDLPAIVAHLQEVTFEIADEPSSFNQWSWQEATADTLTVAFELRDTRGRQAGTLQFHCDARGLLLASVLEENTRLAFAPPLPVLPVDGAPQVLEGTALFASGARSDAFSYGFAVEATAGPAPPPPVPALPSWTMVNSVLTIDVDGDAWIWESQTLWGAGSSSAMLLPATRTQRQHRPASTRTWSETAGAVMLRRRPR